MSMHLAKPYMTTTSYKKREPKITKAKQAQLESDWQERNVRLKGMGLPKETFEQFMEWVYGRGKKTKTRKTYTPKVTPTITETNVKDGENMASYAHPLDSVVNGGCTKKPPPVYTGTKILGIAQMSKSNAIPVFTKDHIIEIARMRRG